MGRPTQCCTRVYLIKVQSTHTHTHTHTQGHRRSAGGKLHAQTGPSARIILVEYLHEYKECTPSLSSSSEVLLSQVTHLHEHHTCAPAKVHTHTRMHTHRRRERSLSHRGIGSPSQMGQPHPQLQKDLPRRKYRTLIAINLVESTDHTHTHTHTQTHTHTRAWSHKFKGLTGFSLLFWSGSVRRSLGAQP
jgi:hypothetical protein